MPDTRHKFNIPIGDWSDDGHGKVEWFLATAAKPIGDVREAWFKASTEHPDLSPATFCCEYEDSVLSKEMWDKLQAAGCPVCEPEDFGSQDMAEVVAWFLNLGDPSLDVRIATSDEAIPMLPFYGHDDKGRHIEGVGYGLFI